MSNRRNIELNPDVDRISYDKPTRMAVKNNRSKKSKNRDRESGPKEHYTRERINRKQVDAMLDDEIDY